VAGWPAGYLLAIGLTVVQLLHFAMRDRSATSFRAQVRLAYLVLLLVALPEKLRRTFLSPPVRGSILQARGAASAIAGGMPKA
jgi:hypothetical protein